MGQMEQQDQTFPHTSQRCYSAEYSQTLNMRPLKATTTLRRQTQKFHDLPVTRSMPGAHTRQRAGPVVFLQPGSPERDSAVAWPRGRRRHKRRGRPAPGTAENVVARTTRSARQTAPILSPSQTRGLTEAHPCSPCLPTQAA